MAHPIESGVDNQPVHETQEAEPKLPTNAVEFFKRLNPEDRKSVEGVIGVVRNLVARYDTNEDYSAYFAVFAVGGMVTKQGERPDVDLLIATDAYFGEGYYDPIFEGKYTDPDFNERYRHYRDRADRRRSEGYNNDWVASSLQDEFEQKGFKVELVDPMPDSYTIGADPKGLLRITPANVDGEPQRKSLDVIIAHRPYSKDHRIAKIENTINDESNQATTQELWNLVHEYRDLNKEIVGISGFEAVDVDSNGEPLPKILLYKAEDLGNRRPPAIEFSTVTVY